ncbi:hypothetical protein TNCV_1667111 [Trichonephila clavipes]|nr:hypothetical protein TNCV_1667111 [Trichonephila clavipes]
MDELQHGEHFRENRVEKSSTKNGFYGNQLQGEADDDDTRATPSLLSLVRFNVHRPPVHGGSSVAPGLEPESLRRRVRDPNHLFSAANHVMSSSPVPLKTRRVGQRCTLNLSRAEMSSRICHSGCCIINTITSTSTTDGAANQTEDAEPGPHGNRSRCPDNASVFEKDKQVADLERGFVAEGRGPPPPPGPQRLLLLGKGKVERRERAQPLRGPEKGTPRALTSSVRGLHRKESSLAEKRVLQTTAVGGIYR